MYHDVIEPSSAIDPSSGLRSREAVGSCPRAGVTVPLDTVTSPGAYVCNWSGHLLRVPERSLLPGGPLALNIVGGEPLTVTKISENPDIALADARGQAWQCGLSVRF